MASVLLVGFAPDLEASLQRTLSAGGHTIRTVRTASAAPQMLLGEAMPALILIRTELPPDTEASTLRDGFALCSAIRALPNGPLSMIILIDHQERLSDKLNGFMVGADEYLVIPFQMAELTLRVDALLRRSSLTAAPATANASVTHFGPLVLDQTTGAIRIADRHEQLTPVEVRLLIYLIANAGRPCTAEELLRHVWRQEPGTGDPALVRMHIRHLRAKLEAEPTAPKLLKTSQRSGYFVAGGETNESDC